MNRKEFTLISIITFLTVSAWIAFGIYHAKTTSTLTVTQLKKVTSLTPKFDSDIINRLQSREE